jgi:peroxiredoxin
VQAESIVRVALMSRGSVSRTREERERHALEHVLLQADDSVSAAYGVYGVPSAVLIDGQGHVASAVAGGRPGVERLLLEAERRPVVEQP